MKKITGTFLKNLIVKTGVVLFSALYFSCSNSAPVITSVEAKIVYDYESEKVRPVQKLSFFLSMDSDVRRVEYINVYNEDTGYRWIINSPNIIQTEGDRQYAGYTHLTAAVADNALVPQGNYTVYYIDSCGNEAVNFFKVEYDKDDAKLTSEKLLEKKSFDKNDIMLAVYSMDSNLLFYDTPYVRFGERNSVDFKEDVKINIPDAAYYRIFYKENNIIYIMPRVDVTDQVEQNLKTAESVN